MVIRETIKTPTPANHRFLESAGGTTPGEFILTSRLLDRVYHDSLEILRRKASEEIFYSLVAPPSFTSSFFSITLRALSLFHSAVSNA